MISASACGPLCQHPGCWKAKIARPVQDEPTDFLPPLLDRAEHELPTLSVSLLEPQRIQRHRSLPPIKTSSGLLQKLSPQRSHSEFQHYQPQEPSVPRVSHIIVQAGFQCHAQKRWIWLPSLHSQQCPPIKTFSKQSQPSLKDLTDDLIQSRPASSKIVHARNVQTRLINSRPKGSSYLDLIKKMGHLNLLDLPHYLQVKLLENSPFRKVLSSHPIDNIPYNVLSESVLLDLMRCQLSPQLPANPSLEGVGIFFDPPDDLTSKQEPKTVVLPSRRPLDWPEPSTYVPSSRKIEPSDLPGPMVKPVGKPSFREYVMRKRSSNVQSVCIDVPQIMEGKSSKADDDCSMSHVTSITATVKDSSEETQKTSDKADEEAGDDEEEEEEVLPQSLDIILPADEPGIRIPSAVEETEELELIGITNSLPPTRDSWRHTSFSTVTPFSENVHPQSANMDRDITQVVMTPPIETKTVSAAPSTTISAAPSSTSILLMADDESGRVSPEFKPDPAVPAPTCTPTNELVDEDEMEDQGVHVTLQPDHVTLQPDHVPPNVVEPET